jgi:hypothetical protein
MSTSHTLPLDMLNAGAQLANIAFNLKQRVGHVISTHDAEVLDRCHRQWDAALASSAAEPAALSSQAPADDQILRDLVQAAEAEMSEEWGCNSYHPSLRPALEAARAALQSRQPVAPVAAVPEGWDVTMRSDDEAITISPPTGSAWRFYADAEPQSKLHVAYRLMRALLAATPTPPVQQVSAAKVAAEALRRASLLQTCIDHKQFQSASALVDALTLWLSSLTAAQAEGGQ